MLCPVLCAEVYSVMGWSNTNSNNYLRMIQRETERERQRMTGTRLEDREKFCVLKVQGRLQSRTGS